jgi:hypothetical protein
MAKRARGSRRPGQRPPLQKTATRPATTAPNTTVAPRPTTLTPQEEARAAELEAQILSEEKAADDARRRSTDRRRSTGPLDAAPRASLAVTATEEYAYVGRDVRRITLIGGSLILFLIVLWVVSQLTGAGPI